MTHGNDSAFQNTKQVIASSLGQSFQCQSLTKREYFAAMAMQGLLSVQDLVIDIGKGSTIFTVVSHNATRYADALIEALNEAPK